MRVLANLIAAAILAGSWFLFAQPKDGSFYQQVKELWMTGRKQQALEIAEARLQNNSNDLGSLLVRLDYLSDFFEMNQKVQFLATLDEIKRAALSITNPNFLAVRHLILENAQNFPIIIEQLTPDIIEADLHKGYLLNSQPGYTTTLSALEADGLLPPLTVEELAYLEANPQRAPWPPLYVLAQLHELHPDQFPTVSDPPQLIKPFRTRPAPLLQIAAQRELPRTSQTNFLPDTKAVASAPAGTAFWEWIALGGSAILAFVIWQFSRKHDR